MEDSLSSCLVSTAVDLGRIRPREQIPEVALVRLLNAGRVTDLLEGLRRTEEKDQLTIELAIIQASTAGMDPALAREVTRKRLVEDKMIFLDSDRITLLYESPTQVFRYSIANLIPELTEAETKLLKLICSSTRRAVGMEELDRVLEMFQRPFREGLRSFFFDNKILQSFEQKGSEYVVSPRAYKSEKNFKMATEVLADKKLITLLDFIRDNPGNPDRAVEAHKGVDEGTLAALSASGVVDPLTLDVRGQKRKFLFSADLLPKREDVDNFDMVKSTLANFRFGEYYSVGANLFSVEKFLQSLLDRGYAGAATPIGTDYNELETRQIVRVEPISGTGKYRFWLLKRDVVEDALSVLKGYVPIKENAVRGGPGGIESVVKSRGDLNIISATKSSVAEAIRMIQEGLGQG